MPESEIAIWGHNLKDIGRVKSAGACITQHRIPKLLDVDSILYDNGSMKTTVDIPEHELAEAMKFTNAKTKRDAIVTALMDFNRRQRMAALVKYSASSESFMSHAELMKLRTARRAK